MGDVLLYFAKRVSDALNTKIVLVLYHSHVFVGLPWDYRRKLKKLLVSSTKRQWHVMLMLGSASRIILMCKIAPHQDSFTPLLPFTFQNWYFPLIFYCDSTAIPQKRGCGIKRVRLPWYEHQSLPQEKYGRRFLTKTIRWQVTFYNSAYTTMNANGFKMSSDVSHSRTQIQMINRLRIVRQFQSRWSRRHY